MLTATALDLQAPTRQHSSVRAGHQDRATMPLQEYGESVITDAQAASWSG
jgi:hypothetical protein